MRTDLNISHPNHEWFEELCALAAIGELSSAEYRDLRNHLAECGHCRQLYSDFSRISTDDLGLVAIQRESSPTPDDAAEGLDGQEILTRLQERLRRERDSRGRAMEAGTQIPGRAPESHPLWRWLTSPVPAYAALALLLAAAVGVGGYKLRESREAAALERLRSELADWKKQAEAQAAEEKSAAQMAQVSRAARDSLQKSLADAQAKYADLLAQQKHLQAALSEANARVQQLGQDLEAASTKGEQQAKLRDESQQKLEAASAELERLRESQAEAMRRAQEQEKTVAALTAKLQRVTQLASAGPGPADNFEVEAKELFGARDLHIVDVYDVDGSGKNRRTYGRVYYVEKKLLVFYAFDLQDKQPKRAAVGFQAWGYREPYVSKPENLGLFYLDDAALNRWVLKVNNPRVLEHIDAVFVTAESPEGSPAPRGRRLLYANLSGPPNHP